MTTLTLWRIEHAETGLGPVHHEGGPHRAFDLALHLIDHPAPEDAPRRSRLGRLVRRLPKAVRKAYRYAALHRADLDGLFFQDMEALAEAGFRLRAYAVPASAAFGDGLQAAFRPARARLLQDLPLA